MIIKAEQLKGAKAVRWAKGRLKHLQVKASHEGMTDMLQAEIQQVRALLRREGGG